MLIYFNNSGIVKKTLRTKVYDSEYEFLCKIHKNNELKGKFKNLTLKLLSNDKYNHQIYIAYYQNELDFENILEQDKLYSVIFKITTGKLDFPLSKTSLVTNKIENIEDIRKLLKKNEDKDEDEYDEDDDNEDEDDDDEEDDEDDGDDGDDRDNDEEEDEEEEDEEEKNRLKEEKKILIKRKKSLTNYFKNKKNEIEIEEYIY